MIQITHKKYHTLMAEHKNQSKLDMEVMEGDSHTSQEIDLEFSVTFSVAVFYFRIIQHSSREDDVLF